MSEARLQCEGEKLGALEAQYREAQRDLDALEIEVVEAAWVARALADFKSIWAVLTPPNRGRLLRALLERVVVDQASGRVDVVLVEFGPGAGSPAPEPRAEGAAA